MEIEIKVNAGSSTEKYTVRSFMCDSNNVNQYKILVISNDNPDNQMVCIPKGGKWIQRTGGTFISEIQDALYQEFDRVGFETLMKDALPESEIDKVYFEEQGRLLEEGMSNSIFTGKPVVDPNILIQRERDEKDH